MAKIDHQKKQRHFKQRCGIIGRAIPPVDPDSYRDGGYSQATPLGFQIPIIETSGTRSLEPGTWNLEFGI